MLSKKELTIRIFTLGLVAKNLFISSSVAQGTVLVLLSQVKYNILIKAYSGA